MYQTRCFPYKLHCGQILFKLHKTSKCIINYTNAAYRAFEIVNIN